MLIPLLVTSLFQDLTVIATRMLLLPCFGDCRIVDLTVVLRTKFFDPLGTQFTGPVVLIIPRHFLTSLFKRLVTDRIAFVQADDRVSTLEGEWSLDLFG